MFSVEFRQGIGQNEVSLSNFFETTGMSDSYQILQVQSRGDVVLAWLNESRVIGDLVRDRLRHDFNLLADRTESCVELDLRSVEYLDGALTSQLVFLWKRLKDRQARLVVVPTRTLAEIFEITKLDRLFEVVDLPKIVV